MGSFLSSIFQRKLDVQSLNRHDPTTRRLESLGKTLESISQKLDRIEAQTAEFLTSIHKKDQFIDEIHRFFSEKVTVFLETSACLTLEESLRKLDEDFEEESHKRVSFHAIRKVEKKEVLRERIRQRRYSSRLENARIILKEQKLLSNLAPFLSEDKSSLLDNLEEEIVKEEEPIRTANAP